MSDGDVLLQAIQAVSATSAPNAGSEGVLLERVTAHLGAIEHLEDALVTVLSEDERRRLFAVLVDEFTDPLDEQAQEAATRLVDYAFDE